MAKQAAKLAFSPAERGSFRWELPAGRLVVDLTPQVLRQLTEDHTARGAMAWGFLIGTIPPPSEAGRRLIIHDCIELDGAPGNFEPHEQLIKHTFREAGAFPAVGIYVRPESSEPRVISELILGVIGYLRTPLATVIVLSPTDNGDISAELNLRIAGESLQNIHKTTTILPPLAQSTVEPAPEPVAVPASPSARRSGQSSMLFAAAALLVGATAALLLWNGQVTPAVDASTRTADAGASGSPSREFGTPDLSLLAARKGRDLEITWNGSAPALNGAGGGSLFVSDGEGRTQIVLEPAHLQSGRVLYVPRTGDIEVRLEVTTADGTVLRESLRVLGAGKTSTPSQRVTLDNDAPAAPPPAPVRIESAEPPVGSARIDAPADRPRMLRTVSAAPAQTNQPDTSAARTSNTSEFIPAEPIRKIPVVVPPNVRPTLTGDTIVDVKVKIDEKGRVTNAELSPQGPAVHTDLAAAAKNAAFLWQFEPARLGARPVPSDYVIAFKFVK
jgi:hypothetical protein